MIRRIFSFCLIALVCGCQPPINYQSSAAYGSPQYQPVDVPFIQPPSFQEELERNEVQVNSEEVESSLTRKVNLTRPNNPFVPIESQSAEKSANECSIKMITSFMDILDCTSVETYNTDGATARYGTNECGFESDSLCRFYSAPDEELQFRRGIFAHHAFQNNSQIQFNQFEDSFSSLTKRPLGSIPSNHFLVIAEPFGTTPKANAILQSDVRCQVGNGDLSFDYWSTVEDMVLKVCTRVGQDRRCSSNIIYAVDSTNVQVQIVHPDVDSFIVEIIATEFNRPGIFIIDNLKYQADLCEITTDLPVVRDNQLIARPSKAFAHPTFDSDKPLIEINGKGNFHEFTTPPSTEIKADTSTQLPNNVPALLVDNESKTWMNSLKIKKMNENACDILNCNFNNDLCHYFQPNLQQDLLHGKWQTANLRLDESRQNASASEREGFAFVGMDDRSIKTKGRKVYILESKEFRLREDATLSFDLYRRSNSISFQICVDSLLNCLYEAPPVKSTSYWKINETVELPKDSKKVYFVVEQIKRFKWLALDNLKLISNECFSN